MTALFAPARLPLASTVASDYHSSIDDDHDESHGESSYGNHASSITQDSYHSYFRSLISRAGRKRKSNLNNGTVLCMTLPESIALPRAGAIGYRTIDEPLGKAVMSIVLEEEMGDVNDPPSSPPELSYSKGSKSSDSSINSDDDLSDPSQPFEELTLEEDVERDSLEDSNLPPDSRPTLKRPPPKSHSVSDLHSITQEPGLRGARSPPMRPMPNGAPRRFSGQHGAPSQQQPINGPYGRQFYRSASSPMPPYMPHGSPRMTSRSPSPSKPIYPPGAASTPQLNTSATPKTSLDAPSLTIFGRRSSWQPGVRKSVKELEAEYNDADEEVPDDAILENVPISPLPGQPPFMRSPSMSSNMSMGRSSGVRSGTPSPNRKPSYANLHSANIPKHAKRPVGPPLNTSYAPARSPKYGRPMLPHSATTGNLRSRSPQQSHSQFRSKSWTEDLNDESKKLSRALEAYAQTQSTNNTRNSVSSPSNDSHRPSISKSKSSSSILDLPSIPAGHKGNVMIDPLPISKEKEAVLTRTRPSWLPPKDPKEEKRHLKEFQKMMARAADAEKKRARKSQEALESKVETQDNIARIWDQHVLPKWNEVINEPRTRELWWRGVTPRSRAEVWQKAIGNELGLTATSFSAALTRANTLAEKCADMIPEERGVSKEAAWLDAIVRDVPTVFPELRMFNAPEAPLHSALSDVLRAYAFYRADVGYIYGTHLVAGVLCLIMPAADAFIVLANLLNRPLPLAFLVHDTVAMQHTYNLVLSTLKYKFTRLHDHLTDEAIGLQPEEYLDPIFRCLFAYNLPHDVVSRIWDIWAFEGDKVLVRAAVAALGRLESRLYGSRQEILSVIGWRAEAKWEVSANEEDFITAVREAGKVDARGGDRV